jgi:RHS repeat-associated protein
VYDGSQRRIEKRVYKNGNLQRTHRFVYQSWVPVVEEVTDKWGNLDYRNLYVYGPGPDGARRPGLGATGQLALIIHQPKHGPPQLSAPIYNHRLDLVGLVDVETGNVVARYGYTPFGETTYAVGSRAEQNPFRFAGAYFDPETTTYYFGYRHYDPRTKQWLSRDPIGEAGGLNLFAYANNEPFNQGPDYLGLRLRKHSAGRNFVNNVESLEILSRQLITNKYIWTPSYKQQKIREYEELYRRAATYQRASLSLAFNALPSYPLGSAHSNEFIAFNLRENFRHRAVTIENQIAVTRRTVRIVGGLQLVGGVSESAAAATAIGGSGGAGTPLLWGVMAHGSDTAAAGAMKLWNGADQQTITSYTFQAAGLNRQHADLLDAGIGIVGSVHSGVYMRNITLQTVGVSDDATIAALKELYDAPVIRVQHSTSNSGVKMIIKEKEIISTSDFVYAVEAKIPGKVLLTSDEIMNLGAKASDKVVEFDIYLPELFKTELGDVLLPNPMDLTGRNIIVLPVKGR